MGRCLGVSMIWLSSVSQGGGRCTVLAPEGWAGLGSQQFPLVSFSHDTFSLFSSGYDDDACKYDNIGDAFAPDCKFVNLRVLASLFGAVLPLLVHAIVMLLGASSHAAVFAGALTIFDMLNVTESRLILTDSQLMFYGALSLTVALQWWRRLETLDDTGKKMGRRERRLWIAAVGLSCGAAVSIKWTALATPFMIAVESAFGCFGFIRRRVPVSTLVKIACVAAVDYTVWFWVHFALLPLSGGGDDFMPVEFQATLKGSPHYDVRTLLRALPTTPICRYGVCVSSGTTDAFTSCDVHTRFAAACACACVL